MSPAEVFLWNPRRAPFRGPLARFYPWKKPVNNFGDLLGPMVVERMVRRTGRDPALPIGDWQLMSVGSVLNIARDGSIIWGSGNNGKLPESTLRFTTLDVRAVRGPRTAALLRARGIPVPDAYGDPALLIPELFPELAQRPANQPRRPMTIVQNFNDTSPPVGVGDDAVVVNPRSPVMDVLRTIAHSEFVAASSLHGLIVAEAFGVPARMVQPKAEHIFKYQDYYESTGRPNFHPVATYQAAIEAGGEPSPVWDPQPLKDAFPSELWRPAASVEAG